MSLVSVLSAAMTRIGQEVKTKPRMSAQTAAPTTPTPVNGDLWWDTDDTSTFGDIDGGTAASSDAGTADGGVP